MSTIAPIFQENIQKQNIFEPNRVNFIITGSSVYNFEKEVLPFFHSKLYDNKDIFLGTPNNELNYYLDKIFIPIINTLKGQFEKLSFYYNDVYFDLVKSKVQLALEYISTIKPDLISLELTEEQSGFFTIKKDDYTFHLQYYFKTDDINEESIISGFKLNKKLDSYVGTFKQCVNEIFNKIHNH